MYKVIIAGIGLLWSMTSHGMQPLNLMPYPSEVQQQVGHFTLTNQLKVFTQHVSEARRELIIEQLGQLQQVEVLWVADKDLADLLVEVVDVTEVAEKSGELIPKLNDNEQYQLSVSPDLIRLHAATERGMLHGIQSLMQLVDSAQGIIPAVEIHDQPRFAWRGLLIDSVRHFMPVDTIKRQLRGMASAKLNVLHWHLTDDQGWRIESLAYPKLQQLASDGWYYTRQQIREVVDYATLLGIRVVPEFDVPGHASAIAVAYPELITQPGPYAMQRHWGVFEPLLDPSKPEVYQFIETMIAELAELFPDDYVHIGGDEIDPTQWQQSQAVQHYMQQHQLADEHQLHAYFNRQVQQILNKYGKQMMGWDEVFATDLPKDIVVQSWRGLDSLQHIASNDYQVLLSTGYYIDQPQEAAYHYRNDPFTSFKQPSFKTQDIKHWQHWQFTMPRLKGSAVSGEFVLLSSEVGKQVLLRFNNQHARLVNALEPRANFQRFTVDSWMGPSQFELDLSKDGIQQGRILIGNTPYSVSGTRLAQGSGSDTLPAMVQDFVAASNVPTDLPKLHKNILGGEAAIWSEIVQADNLDLRLWPRLYAIAERLWSPVTLTDEDKMYRRLTLMQTYASDVIGLEFTQQQRVGFKQLTSQDADIEPLVILAEALEQAQYYTRHHSKFQQDNYHQLAELKQFVDYLPAQSLTLVELKRHIGLFQQGDQLAQKFTEQRLQKWQQNLPKLNQIIANYPKLHSLAPVVTSLSQVVDIGQRLVAQCAKGEPLNLLQQRDIRQQLWQAAQLQQEMVVSSALAIEALVFKCRT
jgi:hexosaminidase